MKRSNPAHTGKEAYNYFLGYLIPETNLNIYEFNRIIKDLNGLDCHEFLDKISHYFIIEKTDPSSLRPLKKHQFGMYLKNDYYLLTLKKENCPFENDLDRLDAMILYKTILKPVLGIHDLRNNNRIDYFHGKDSLKQMKYLIDNGAFTLAFTLSPVSIEELKAIADNNLRMPPKSTYIEPKLLSALSIYEF